jgi:hypothetical protein
MPRNPSVLSDSSGSRHDQDIPLNYVSSYCRIVLTQTYAGMAGPTGSFPYNTLVLAFHLTLQPADCHRMTHAILDLKFEVPTATDKCIVRASLVFRDRQDSKREQGFLPGDTSHPRQSSANSAGLRILSYSQQRDLKATIGWSGPRLSAGVFECYQYFIYQDFPYGPSYGFFKTKDGQDILYIKYDGALSSSERQQSFAVVLEVPRSVTEQGHDVSGSFTIRAHGISGLLATAYVPPKPCCTIRCVHRTGKMVYCAADMLPEAE